MKFTIHEINDALAVTEFTEIVKRLKRIGVLSYEYDLVEGVYTFFGDNEHQVTIQSSGVNINVGGEANPDAAKEAIERHQAGVTDFEGFCQEIAQTGVVSWEANLELLHIQYNGPTGKAIIREHIPQFED